MRTKMTTEEVTERLKAVGYELKGVYEGAGKKALMTCRHCGTDRFVVVGSVLHLGGCPGCNKIARASGKVRRRILRVCKPRLSHEDVEGRLDGSGIRWVGRYVDSTTKVRFTCEECDHEWDCLPASLFSGSGCPACFTRKKRGIGSWKNRGSEEGNKILEDFGSYIRIDISSPTVKSEMLINKDDWEGIKGPRRICHAINGYAALVINGKRQLVHRHLMGYPPQVDHINGDKTDNRKENLRECNTWQNCANRNKPGKANTSGVRGVSFNKVTQKWTSQLILRGKVVHQAAHLTLKDAATARRAAELEWLGEFAPSV